MTSLGTAMTSDIVLRAGPMSAIISARGAEMRSLAVNGHYEILWPGEAGSWNQTSPLLFPLIGRADRFNTARHNGATYELPMHGFAHLEMFDLIEAHADYCKFRLQENPRTLSCYPFAFQLDVEYRLRADGITVVACVYNPGPTLLPYKFGFHPGLLWPLPGLGRKSDYQIRLEHGDGGTMVKIKDGMIQPDQVRNEMSNGALALRDELFSTGARLFPDVGCGSVSYGIHDISLVDVRFQNLNSLAVWTRVGSDFICIEPWKGVPNKEWSSNNILDMDGIQVLESEKSSTHQIDIRILSPVFRNLDDINNQTCRSSANHLDHSYVAAK